MNNRLNQDIEREHFNALACEKGEIWWGSTTKAGIKRLERRAKLLKQNLTHLNNPKVFELGCGTGAFSRYILSELPSLDLTSCDISTECIRIASKRYSSYKNAKFLVSDITMKPSSLGVFDVVIGNSILHHLPIRSSLIYCMQILKPGGIIMFFEPNMMNPQIAIEKNIRFIGKILQNTENETAFFRWSLKKILQEVGFNKVSVIPFDFLHPIIPSNWVVFFSKFGERIETIPFLKEFSGSLLITASKS
ncbi:MAG: methyltransferase [Nitrospirae bacterium]|nr:methyltransferase [Nitrospirota bacterium]